MSKRKKHTPEEKALEKLDAEHRNKPEARYGRDVLEYLGIVLRFQGPEKLNAKLARMRAANMESLTTGTQEVFAQLVMLMIAQGAPPQAVIGQLENALGEAMAFMRDLHGY